MSMLRMLRIASFTFVPTIRVCIGKGPNGTGRYAYVDAGGCPTNQLIPLTAPEEKRLLGDLQNCQVPTFNFGGYTMTRNCLQGFSHNGILLVASAFPGLQHITGTPEQVRAMITTAAGWYAPEAATSTAPTAPTRTRKARAQKATGGAGAGGAS